MAGEKDKDDTTVVVEPAAEANPGGQVVIEKPKPKTVSAEEGVDSLKKQLAEEKTARQREAEGRQEAERRAYEAQRVAAAARGEVQDTNLAMVTSAIETVKENRNKIVEAIARARADQDLQAEEQLRAMLDDNRDKLKELEAGAQKMKEQPKPTVPQAVDPVEALARQLTPRSANWVRAHPEYARDPKLYQRMLAAHNLTVTEGIEPDSDEYFENVETTLKIRKVINDDDDGESPFSGAAAPSKARVSPAAAPVSRGGAQGTPGSSAPRRITLTAEQAEFAKLNDMTPLQYWENMQHLKKDGRIN